MSGKFCAGAGVEFWVWLNAGASARSATAPRRNQWTPIPATIIPTPPRRSGCVVRNRTVSLDCLARLPGTLLARNRVERRGLIFQLVRRDFEQRVVGSAGWLWGVIHPLVLLIS